MVENSNRKIRKYGRNSRPCKRCGTYAAVIRAYSLLLCRRCFREVSTKLGFKKFS